MNIKPLSLSGLMLLGAMALQAQDKTYPIKTTAKPNDLKSFSVSEANGNIDLLFVKKGKKNEVYTNYVFDNALNLVAETEEELDAEQVKKKSFWQSWRYASGSSISGIIRDSVLSVENNMVGNLVIMTGYIGWTSQKNPMNGADITSQGFIYREKIKVKDEKGKGLYMIAYQTDAPAEFFATGKSYGNKVGFGDQKRVSASSGDVLIVSALKTMGQKDEATGEKVFGDNFKFVAQRYSAKTLEKITETPFEFKYSNTKLYDQPSTDDSNDMLLVFSPQRGATKPFQNPNKSEYEYIRVGLDTKIKERVTFISPYGRLDNMHIFNIDDETIIIGTSKSGNEDKFAYETAFTGNHDQFVTIRIKQGQTPVVKATAIKSLAGPIINFTATEAVKTSDNQIWITGQHWSRKGADPISWSDLYTFGIAPDGSIGKHLVMPQAEKTSEKAASPVSLTKLNDGSLLWSAYEITKKGNMYPKYAKISNGNLGSVVYPGNKQYVVNDQFPNYISPDKKALIYFGNTEDNKQLWLHKEEL